jgi:hypothetical protein
MRLRPDLIVHVSMSKVFVALSNCDEAAESMRNHASPMRYEVD